MEIETRYTGFAILLRLGVISVNILVRELPPSLFCTATVYKAIHTSSFQRLSLSSINP